MPIHTARDRTPREVVAQALDYASWVEDLKPGWTGTAIKLVVTAISPLTVMPFLILAWSLARAA